MSKFYRAMNQKTHMNARQPRPAAVIRPNFKSDDKTGDSPLVAPPACKRWRIAVTLPMQERIAVQSLMQAGYSAWYPQETVVKVDHRCKLNITSNIPLFRGYVFIGLESHAIKAIRDCKGISALLPSCPSPALISELWRRQSAGEFAAEKAKNMEEGQLVTVSFGPFSSLSGVVLKTEGERMRVLTTIFGHEREVVADIENVQAA